MLDTIVRLPPQALTRSYEPPISETPMPVRITLDNKEVIEVDVTLADWNRAYRQALDGNSMVEIEGPDGRVLGINPQRVNLVEATEVQPPPGAARREPQVA
jgi:hypothetical protein